MTTTPPIAKPTLPLAKPAAATFASTPKLDDKVFQMQSFTPQIDAGVKRFVRRGNFPLVPRSTRTERLKTDLRESSAYSPVANFAKGIRQMAREVSWLSNTQKAASFRDAVIANHFTPMVAATHKCGIEVEFGGLSVERTIELILAKLGGKHTGSVKDEELCKVAHYIKGTAIGDIRIDQETFSEGVERAQRNGRFAAPVSSLMLWTARLADQVMTANELVTEPLTWDKVQILAQFMNDLADAGAKGASTLGGRLVSTQVNVGINWRDSEMLKTLLGNYYRTQAAIRADATPAIGRRPYITRPEPGLIEKLDDPDWHPDLHELFDVYQEYSHQKLSSIQAFCALIMDERNRAAVKDSNFGKERKPRSAVEFRESNTEFFPGTTASGEYLLRETKFALAMVGAAERGKTMTTCSELDDAAKRASSEQLGDGTAA